VFEIRKVSYNLHRIVKRLNQNSFSVEQIDAAANEIAEAARVVVQAYGEQSKKDKGNGLRNQRVINNEVELSS
jgi:hypothetical protein